MRNRTRQRLLQRVEALREEAVEFLAEMVRAESVNPPGDTRKVSDVVLRKVKDFSDRYEVVTADDSAPNLFVTLNPGGRPQLLYNGHLDTVPVGDASRWRVDPFGAVIEGGIMYGRGVADMKGGCAAMIMASKALHQEGIPLKGSLVVNLVSDEETGGGRGAGFLMQQEYYDPDMVVVGEMTNRNRIAASEKGVVVMALTTRGKAAHGSTPHLGVNAIEKMVEVLHHLHRRLRPILHGRPSGILSPPTFNVGTIQGGVSFNVVPDSCSVLIDRRTLPGEDPDEACEEIRRLVREVEARDPELEATLEVLGSGPSFETSPDEHICRIATETLEELGMPSELVGYDQVSDGRFFAAEGIPTILIGPGTVEAAHAANE